MRGVAGSIPAGHIGSVAQLAELPPLNRGRCRFEACRSHLGRTATGAVPRLENGWTERALGVRLPLLPPCSGSRARAARRASPQGACRDARTEAWPRWQGSALLRAGGERRSQVRVLLPPLHDATSSNGQDDRLLPGECWFDPSRRSRVGEPWFPHRPPPHADRMDPPCLASRPAKPASGRHGSRIERSLCLTRFTPRSSSGSRMPASQAGDAGSNPARGLEGREPGVPPPSALGRVWRSRPGCLPGEAGSIPVESASRRSSVDEHHAPTVADGGSTPPGETASQG